MGTEQPLVRPMTAADLGATKHVFRDTLRQVLIDNGRPPELLDGMCPLPNAEGHHLLATDADHHWVAEARGSIVGYVSAITRGPIWFLSGFWVLPEFQGGGIGKTLLGNARAAGERHGARIFSVYSAVTEQAQALYVRMGMVPRTPLYNMTLPLDAGDRALARLDLRDAPPLDIAPMSLETAPVQSLASIDYAVRGVPRSQDHRFWLGRPTRTCLVAFDANRPVGYAYVTDGGRIAPAAALEPRYLRPLLAAAVRTAVARVRARLAAPGAAAPAPTASPAASAHGSSPVASDEELLAVLPGTSMEALTFLLSLGFRIRNHGIFMTSEEFGRFDRYVISGAGLL